MWLIEVVKSILTVGTTIPWAMISDIKREETPQIVVSFIASFLDAVTTFLKRLLPRQPAMMNSPSTVSPDKPFFVKLLLSGIWL